MGATGWWVVGESDDALDTQIYHPVRKCHVDLRATSVSPTHITETQDRAVYNRLLHLNVPFPYLINPRDILPT